MSSIPNIIQFHSPSSPTSNSPYFMKILCSLSWSSQSYVLSPVFEIPRDLLTFLLWYIQRWFSGKESACRNKRSVPGWGRSPGGGNGNPLQYSCLENPMNRGAWWATVHGVSNSQTQLSMHARQASRQPDMWVLTSTEGNTQTVRQPLLNFLTWMSQIECQLLSNSVKYYVLSWCLWFQQSNSPVICKLSDIFPNNSISSIIDLLEKFCLIYPTFQAWMYPPVVVFLSSSALYPVFQNIHFM